MPGRTNGMLASPWLDSTRAIADNSASGRNARAVAARIRAEADSERRRIERELHDGTQQDLVALAVNLQLARELADADPPAAKSLLEELRDDVQKRSTVFACSRTMSIRRCFLSWASPVFCADR